jgi:hypothetical protein
MMTMDEVELLLVRTGRPGVDRRRNSPGTPWAEDLERLHVREDVPSRRLEDKIRDLCARALTAEAAELEGIFAELKSSLHEHSERLRQTMVTKLATKMSARAERRMF